MNGQGAGTSAALEQPGFEISSAASVAEESTVPRRGVREDVELTARHTGRDDDDGDGRGQLVKVASFPYMLISPPGICMYVHACM